MILIFLIIVTVIIAAAVAYEGDRRFLVFLVLAAWMIFLPVLTIAHTILPFQGGGDDESYLYAAAVPVGSFSELFDLSRFSYVLEQPGYPALLSAVAFLFSEYDLLQLKFVNLAEFIVLSLVWYQIGVCLESRKFGRAMATTILLLTPLWFYFLYLLKDMSVVLLHSLFLLGLVMIEKKGSFRAWCLIVLSTGALILFRSAAVLINIAVLIVAMAVSFRSKYNGLKLAIAVAVAAGVLALATNPAILANLGITASNRVLGSEDMLRTAAAYREENTISNRLVFPIIYLLSETTALNPVAWQQADAFLLRGVLALPWIGLVVPFFVAGLSFLAKRPELSANHGFFARILNARIVSTSWRSLVLFLLSYAVVSWQVGDATRWRISDMPIFAAIALAAWFRIGNAERRVVSLALVFFVSVIVLSAIFMARA